ncbi:serine threonine- kinase RIO1-like [Brachionus plicatilis]|uniref:Serine/threonine-protein kinase RIO1 n=1 Tax=Brachionus plicatilis TaxID=10195 RepID=A0A3M7S6D1_BRAPC|nr:serine threonine- kinase RIO1-like [Brachionus plicatilis]
MINDPTLVDQFEDAEENVEEIAVVQNENEDHWDEDEEEFSDFDEDFTEIKGPNAQNTYNKLGNGAAKKTHFQPNQKVMEKYIDKINIDKYEPIATKLNNCLEISDKIRGKDKSDRATVEQVMDPRTRMIIFKMIQRGVVNELNGCISTGKEANVYHSTTNDNNGDLAVKVYKTSILTFKDRDKYVTGEFRFRHGYCKHNPRKMVRTWAEKEFRNLTRIHQAGIKCPEPIFLRSHVLVMRFIGEDGFPAPLLKDANISESQARKLYLDSVKLVHRIYNISKLVHADLSEFNILFFKEEIFVIDVSQSVEHDHPHALEFLRKDCSNINEFFRKKNVPVLTVKELFDFVTDPTINESNMNDYLNKMMEITSNRKNLAHTEKVDDEVFKHSYIPYTMNDVVDIERDFRRAKQGENLIYTTLLGLNPDLSKPREAPVILEKEEETKVIDQSEESSEEEEESEESENSESESEDEDGTIKVCKINREIHHRPRDESPNSRRTRKAAVKEERREKRKSKTPKHMKKRAEKIAKIKKHSK